MAIYETKTKKSTEPNETRFPPPGSSVHLVGVGGAGMSAIARILVSLGYRVTGSDLKESSVITRLRSIGVTCAIGHDASNIDAPDVVVYSAAVRSSNPELQEAQRRSISVIKRADALAYISSLKRSICVAGTHGKTSTSSMLALVLSEAGFDPSFMVGAELNEAGTNARWGTGEWQVLEADESDGTFLRLSTDIAVVTNVDKDHLENWCGSFERLKEGFMKFMGGAKQLVVANRSDHVTRELCHRLVENAPSSAGQSRSPSFPKIAYFGYDEGPGVGVRVLEVSEHGTWAEFFVPEAAIPRKIHLPLIGAHFALNSAAVVAVATYLDIEMNAIWRGLEAFEGIERRMVRRGEESGVVVYDDYAHSPAEVEATVAASRAIASRRGGRVLAVFQPHLYSRTSSYYREFAGALVGCDEIYVTDVYGSREDPIPGVTGRLVADEIKKADPSKVVQYFASRRPLAQRVAMAAESGDVVVVMGAGDITAVIPRILDELRNRAHLEEGKSST